MARGDKADMDALTKMKRPMKECCAMLGIHEESHLHQNLVANVIKLTAYHKRHVNKRGKITVRAKGVLTSDFKALVTMFLKDLKVGPLFFPEVLPADDGLKSSYINLNHRLVYNHACDKGFIWAGVALMIEQIKAHAKYANPNFLKGLRMRLESFDGNDCDKCGSDEVESFDKRILFCLNCHIGYHIECQSMLADGGRWFCNEGCRSVCRKTTTEWLGSISALTSGKRSKHRAESNLEQLDRPLQRNVPTDTGTPDNMSFGESSTLVDESSDHINCDSTMDDRNEIDNTIVAHVPQDFAQTHVVPNRIGPAKDILTKASMPRTHGSNGPPAISALSDPLVTSSLNFSNIVELEGMSDSTPAASLLTDEEIKRTMLYTRLQHEPQVFRKISLENVFGAHSLFQQIAALWATKVPGFEVDRLLAYDDEVEGYVEITNSAVDFQELVQLIRREWDLALNKRSLAVKLTVLAEGETVGH